ncbi:DNA ligase B [archaeon HR01]|nr:DNA ligase B [archaeon HR01]
MLFAVLASYYEKLEATTKRLEMIDILSELFSKTPPELMDKVAYMTLGEVYPAYRGLELGVAEKLALKAVQRVSGARETTISQLYAQHGDVGSVALILLGQKAQTTLSFQELTVEYVYSSLEQIAKASGPGAQETKLAILSRILSQTSPVEAKHILRIVTGNMRLGVADMTILEALAKVFGGSKEEFERAYNLSSDIGLVAKTAALEGLNGIRDFRIRVGVPVRCMLAERLSTAEEILLKTDGRAFVEHKYDGERMQIHKSRETVLIFSRRQENITSQYPDVVSAVLSNIEADEAIMECEAVPVSLDTGEMLPFQELMHRRRKKEIEKAVEEYPITLYFFDLLYLDGRDLTNSTFLERRTALEKIVKPSETVKLSYGKLVTTPEDLDKLFNEAVELGCEGVIAKSVGEDSVYRAGARGWQWIKYKRDYRSEMIDTVDLVVVGAFHGRGRRTGRYGALLMASYDDERDVFQTVCKVGSGFKDEDLEYFTNLVNSNRLGHPSPRLETVLEADVWVDPRIVLEIIGAEITLSPTHTCAKDSIKAGHGLAIRFPRYTGRYRDDRKAEDATTSKEILEMYRRQLKRIEAKVSEER